MSKSFRVTDHALMRYIERVMGLNLDGVRLEIEGKAKAGALAGARRIVADNAIFTITENPQELVVSTVLLKDSENPCKKPPLSRQPTLKQRKWENRHGRGPRTGRPEY